MICIGGHTVSAVVAYYNNAYIRILQLRKINNINNKIGHILRDIR